MAKKADLRLAFAAAFTTALAVAIVVLARAPGRAGREGAPEEGALTPVGAKKAEERPLQPPVFIAGPSEREVEPARGEEEEADLPPRAQAFGKVVFFPETREIHLEARVCLDAPNAVLEYFACFQGGKEHESIVAVRANAANVNLAMIALRYCWGGGVEYVGDPRAPQGDPVLIEAEWRGKEGETVRVRAEDLMWNKETGKPMRRTAWLYTGSRMVKDDETGRYIYMAAVDGVMAACYRDPHAIFNSPLDTGADDVYYFINRELCPPKGTAVKVVITPGSPEEVQLYDLPEEE